MQSRLAFTVSKLNRISSTGLQKLSLGQRIGYFGTSTADPAVHTEDPEEVGANDTYVSPNPLHNSSPKLEHSPVSPKIDPIMQQKRRNSTDINPWPAESRETSRKQQRDEQQEDDKEYFKHHKASPLSEIEIADTRKPVTRATDGTAQSSTPEYGGGGIITWRPEQLDSAEDSLRRAMEIFRTNAMRGDPDSPHGRVLRELRGEYW